MFDEFDSKSIFTSVTFWGIVIALAGHISARFGYTISGDTDGLANEMATYAGELIAFIGRLRANTSVHLVKTTDPDSTAH